MGLASPDSAFRVRISDIRISDGIANPKHRAEAKNPGGESSRTSRENPHQRAEESGQKESLMASQEMVGNPQREILNVWMNPPGISRRASR